MGFGGVITCGVVGLCLLVVRGKADSTCVSGAAITGGTERGLLGYPGVGVASFGGGELSAVGLPNSPPYVPCADPKGLRNRLLGDA